MQNWLLKNNIIPLLFIPHNKIVPTKVDMNGCVYYLTSTNQQRILCVGLAFLVRGICFSTRCTWRPPKWQSWRHLSRWVLSLRRPSRCIALCEYGHNWHKDKAQNKTKKLEHAKRVTCTGSNMCYIHVKKLKLIWNLNVKMFLCDVAITILRVK